MIFPQYELLFAVACKKLTGYTDPLPDICIGVEVDSRGRLYAALRNGDIYKVSGSVKNELWKTGLGSCAALAYAPVTDLIISYNRQHGTFIINRIPVDNPADSVNIASMQEEAETVKRLATDAAGGIYLYDWGQNAILMVE